MSCCPDPPGPAKLFQPILGLLSDYSMTKAAMLTQQAISGTVLRAQFLLMGQCLYTILLSILIIIPQKDQEIVGRQQW